MRRGWLNLALLLATAVSVFFVFLWLWHGGVESEALDDQLWGTGFFTVSVLLILGSHEMGHWAMAKAHGVETSFPFFIPFPLGFGTLGAVTFSCPVACIPPPGAARNVRLLTRFI